MAKIKQDEGKMIKRGVKSKKVIFLAIEVWVDVLGFIRRIQLARRVCFVNWKIHDICWPRLHGNKVAAHPVRNIIIGYYCSTALLLKDNKIVQFPECPVPNYITGFEFLNHQVLAFLSLIAPHITTTTTNKLQIHFTKNMSNLDENQLASMNRLFNLLREKITAIHSIGFHCSFSNIQFMPADVDNGVKIIFCYGIEESDIPVLMAFLASPRPDGQQQVLKMYFRLGELALAQKLLDAIKEEFRTSIQQVPQPFYLNFYWPNLNIPQSEEENPRTHETLRIMPCRNELGIYRHPRGQLGQWVTDARKRLHALPIDNFITRILVDFRSMASMDNGPKMQETGLSNCQ